MVIKVINVIVWGGAILGVAIGFLILITGFSTANSAPQEAVVTSLACACAILPYCFARAVSEILGQFKK